jgi:F-type H+-transporting ATPase subunit gamma
MATLREIKNRIKSIKSTQKITKAMEMMAASKMKKAQQSALAGRPYMQKLEEVINNLVHLSDPPLHHPLLDRQNLTPAAKDENGKPVIHSAYILLTSNRGLCGSFNSGVLKKMIETLQNDPDERETIITLGRKGRQTMERIGSNVIADFENISDKPTFLDTVGISRTIIDEYLKGKLDKVYFVYNHFYSTLSQKPIVKQLLPISADLDKLPKNFHTDYIFEADKTELLDKLLRRYLEMSVYQTVLESVASEHSARMMAMRTASDNAKEIIARLTLHYNKARQSKITTQILEVVSGSVAQ